MRSIELRVTDKQIFRLVAVNAARTEVCWLEENGQYRLEPSLFGVRVLRGDKVIWSAAPKYLGVIMRVIDANDPWERLTIALAAEPQGYVGTRGLLWREASPAERELLYAVSLLRGATNRFSSMDFEVILADATKERRRLEDQLRKGGLTALVAVKAALNA